MSHGAGNSIISAISLTSQLIDYFRTIKHFPKEHRQFHREITALQALLDDVRFLQDDEPSKTWLHGFKSAVVDSGILDNYQEAVQHLLKKTNSESGVKGGMQKLNWTFTKDDIQDTLEKIERLKSVIQLALQADNM
jgi:hypothetical protein